jgi:hypothetical protein
MVLSRDSGYHRPGDRLFFPCGKGLCEREGKDRLTYCALPSGSMGVKAEAKLRLDAATGGWQGVI